MKDERTKERGCLFKLFQTFAITVAMFILAAGAMYIAGKVGKTEWVKSVLEDYAGEPQGISENSGDGASQSMPIGK
jgi:hypothetical protein